MPFRPDVGDRLEIGGTVYRFEGHPAAPALPYGQSGRRATVYQLSSSGTHTALKVFQHAYRSPRNALSAEALRPFAALPGLEVCDRLVLTPERHAQTLAAEPDLTYAVLMPWVLGETWQEVVLGRQPISAEQSEHLAAGLVRILVQMERAGIAHCDLSGPNMLVTLAPVDVALVDVEELYAPHLPRPEQIPGGSYGYAHRTSPAGVWGPTADRFAGGIILAEILGWCDPAVRAIAGGEQFFEQDELQVNSERFQLLLHSLRERWGGNVANTLAEAWHSARLADCPPFAQWAEVLAIDVGPAPDLALEPSSVGPEDIDTLLAAGRIDEAVLLAEEAYLHSPQTDAEQYARALVAQGGALERGGNLVAAIAAYRAAQRVAPPGGIQQELSAILRVLQRPITNTQPTEPIVVPPNPGSHSLSEPVAPAATIPVAAVPLQTAPQPADTSRVKDRRRRWLEYRWFGLPLVLLLVVVAFVVWTGNRRAEQRAEATAQANATVTAAAVAQAALSATAASGQQTAESQQATLEAGETATAVAATATHQYLALLGQATQTAHAEAAAATQAADTAGKTATAVAATATEQHLALLEQATQTARAEEGAVTQTAFAAATTATAGVQLAFQAQATNRAGIASNAAPPTEGVLRASAGALATQAAGVDLHAFVASARFHNPTDPDTSWDYGFWFRNGDGEPYLVFVRSDQSWGLALGDQVVASGPALGLRTAPGERNLLEIVVEGHTIALYVNGSFVSEVSAPENNGTGDVGVGVRFPDTEAAVSFDSFTVLSLDTTRDEQTQTAVVVQTATAAGERTAIAVSTATAGTIQTTTAIAVATATASAEQAARDGSATAAANQTAAAEATAAAAQQVSATAAANQTAAASATALAAQHATATTAAQQATMTAAAEATALAEQQGSATAAAHLATMTAATITAEARTAEAQQTAWASQTEAASAALSATAAVQQTETTVAQQEGTRIANATGTVSTGQTQTAFAGQTATTVAVITSTAAAGQTAAAAAEATQAADVQSSAVAYLTAVASSAPVIAEMASVSLPHQAGAPTFELFDAVLADFVVEAEFHNPYSADVHAWDYGFWFRLVDGESPYYQIVIASDGFWEFHRSDVTGAVAYGEIDNLRRSENESNLLSLVVRGGRGDFYVNGRYVTQLDVSAIVAPGSMGVGTGFLAGHAQDGATTIVTSLTLRSPDAGRPDAQTATAAVQSDAALSATAEAHVQETAAAFLDGIATMYPPVATSGDGRLAHDDDASSELVPAGVSVSDFEASATFFNPYAAKTSAWDYGFRFRFDGNERGYVLYVASTGNWYLYSYQSGEVIDSGPAPGLNLDDGAANTLVLVVQGEVGYLYVNGTYIAQLRNLASRRAGDVELGTGFTQGSELVGRSTGYQDFVVRALD